MRRHCDSIMKIILFLILIGFIGSSCGATSTTGNAEKKTGFCGFATEGACQNDEECVVGGCSSQVCQSKKEEPSITTCEWLDCYRAESFGVECKCVENKCRWN